jgi:uncharacterized membrane protein
MNNKILILIFLVIFIFSIVSLYYEVININNLKFPEFHIVKTNQTTPMKNDTTLFYEERSDDNAYLFVLIVITTIVGLILYLERDNLKVAILRMISILGFFYSLFFISRFFPLPSGGGANKPTPYAFEISTIFTFLMLLALVIALASLISSLGIRFHYQRVKKGKIDIGIKARKKLEEIITDITEKYSKKVSGLRELITECYKSMCEFLEKYGVDNPKYLTAREFEEHVFNLIGYRSENLSNLTKLFEIAKYSKEELKEEDYNSALKLLNNIKEELKNEK